MNAADKRAKAKQEQEKEVTQAPKAEDVCTPPEWSKKKDLDEEKQKLIQAETSQSGSVSDDEIVT